MGKHVILGRDGRTIAVRPGADPTIGRNRPIANAAEEAERAAAAKELAVKLQAELVNLQARTETLRQENQTLRADKASLTEQLKAAEAKLLKARTTAKATRSAEPPKVCADVVPEVKATPEPPVVFAAPKAEKTEPTPEPPKAPKPRTKKAGTRKPVMRKKAEAPKKTAKRRTRKLAAKKDDQ